MSRNRSLNTFIFGQGTFIVTRLVTNIPVKMTCANWPGEADPDLITRSSCSTSALGARNSRNPMGSDLADVRKMQNLNLFACIRCNALINLSSRWSHSDHDSNSHVSSDGK